MKIISFAWTTPALVTGNKTVTRRGWDDRYAARFKPGELVQAYNRSPRHKGECVAIIRIVYVKKQLDQLAPDSDYEAEGFAWFATGNGDALPKSDRLGYLETVSRESYDAWRQRGGSSWVCRFELVELTPQGQKLADWWNLPPFQRALARGDSDE